MQGTKTTRNGLRKKNILSYHLLSGNMLSL